MFLCNNIIILTPYKWVVIHLDAFMFHKWGPSQGDHHICGSSASNRAKIMCAHIPILNIP